ncbi:sensor histidine kinase [Streptomyces sp. FL07-04A]|uniref:sensor histidine kinase n=1 Tax=Streptomyces sp. FL07-04A TaxID=3028658 RepID=UPI0029AADF9C|nr:histidine kinase [Streptomyces sp. FL07-04A]MDX3577545.1 histidine kinase [Streptomyces sp. FL07-04A]
MTTEAATTRAATTPATATAPAANTAAAKSPAATRAFTKAFTKARGRLPRRRVKPPATDPPTSIPIQVNALQALSRQIFGFRLAMIAVASPAALLNAAPGTGVRLVGAAVVVTFMGSYVLFRDWERFGPLLLKHPSLLVADTLLGALLLVSAGPGTTLAYVSVCTPLLAGIVYGWRGAACFASLQSLILLLVHAALRQGPDVSVAERLLLPGLCVITGAMGSTLRGLMLRFGAATQALTDVKARLAVTEAVAAERARLAREMHDSVAKTLHGVALAADALARSAGSPDMDPARVRRHAELIARAARHAAAESRELLTDLRREEPEGTARGVDVLPELAARTRDFAARTGLAASYHATGDRATLPVPPAVARHLLTITSEAMDNVRRHADPTRVAVHAGVHGDRLCISVYDDGRGLPDGTTLEELRRSGHFGLVGMVERAAAIGARIDIGRGAHPGGTEVRLELPLTASRP